MRKQAIWFISWLKQWRSTAISFWMSVLGPTVRCHPSLSIALSALVNGLRWVHLKVLCWSHKRRSKASPPLSCDLKVNGEAIFKSKPWSVCQNETTANVFYTRKGKTLYTLIKQWPADNHLKLQFPVPTDDTEVRMLGMSSSPNLAWTRISKRGEGLSQDERKLGNQTRASGLEVELPPLNPATMPCHHAWVLAMTGIANL